MGGKTKTVSTTPRDIVGLRGDLSHWLRGGAGPAPAQNPFADNGIKMFRDLGQKVTDQYNAAQGVGGQAGGPQPGAASPFDRMFTQSMDQIGGSNSAFFQNMMSQLNPMFQQQREDTVAHARERSGNLTGSGYANTMGSMMNRTLGDQQAQVANLFQNLAGMESQRQAGDAQRFLQSLMGMATTGVGPEQVVQTGGMGSVLGPIGSVLGTAAAGPIGTVIGNKVGGWLGGNNNQAAPQGQIVAQPNMWG